ncbi:MAG: sugar-binding domain-containing protein [Planctomycetota bacterium]
MGKKAITLVFAGFMLVLVCGTAEAQLLTKWAGKVKTDNVWRQYPRPQMVRKDWLNLNGQWEYAIRPKGLGRPGLFEGTILVPFCAESALSGVGKQVGQDNRLWYRRVFDVPKKWTGKRILLNFGAVDWETTVWVNGKELGTHRGGYDAFSFDITDALNEESSQEILVSVWDPIDAGYQPRGKQVKEPRGIWYTSVTGIWQTVWLEPVNRAYIKQLKIVPDIDAEQVRIRAICSAAMADYTVEAEVKDGWFSRGKSTSSPREEMVIAINKPKLWRPDKPFLYDLKVILRDADGNKLDEVKSYFGMRKISLGKDERGITRMMLNNKFVFQFGFLDQGWWSDGLYTAPSDKALRYDIEVTKKLGFNLARKHVKIEPERWYYWCDKLGLLVWQDMPSGDKYIGHEDPDIERTEESANQFKLELMRMVDNFGNHPSIVVWVPYNEGWGQYDTAGITDMIKAYDPTRLVNSASGWTDRGTGDIHDIHSYPGPATPEPEENRAIVLGEFGGLGLPVSGHTWQEQDNWGYRNLKTKEQLTTGYRDLIKKLYPMVTDGLSAAVYTQTTDVEIEVNGMMTYDRAVVKMDFKDISRINTGYVPPIIKSERKIFLDSTMVEIFNATRPGEIRYITGGGEPHKKSKIYRGPFEVEKTATIKARTFWPDRTKSDVAELSVEKVKLRRPEKITGLKPGLKYAYFEDAQQQWDKLPDFNELTPETSGIATGCDLSYARRDEYFGLVFDGFIEVPRNGIYTFYTNSDDGSKLYVDLTEVVSNDFTHPMSEKSGQIALSAGVHPFKVIYYQGMGGRGLKVACQGPGVEKRQIPSQALFHTEEN